MKIKVIVGLAIVGMLAVVGCVTSKVATTSPGGTVTYTTVVNTNNLLLDALILKSATATSIQLVLNNGHNDSLVQPLKDAQEGLDAILNGVSTNNINDVIVLLKAQKNNVLTQEVSDLMTLVSALEQKYITGLDASTTGYIVHTFAMAVNKGLLVGLQGH